MFVVLNFEWFHSSIIPRSILLTLPLWLWLLCLQCDAWFTILPVEKYQQAVPLWLTKKVVYSDRLFIIVELA